MAINRQTVVSPDAEASKWHSEHIETYTAFTRLLHVTVENLVRAARIDYLSVTSRTKSLQSFVEKMNRKGYESPDQATDVSGVRVVTFIESEVLSVTELLKQSFTVLPAKSLNKSEELGDSQVGYRSIHLVCELGPDRLALPEYKPFKGMLFELQIRTVLQHAWAEIDHDRGYKFNGVLPPDLRRRLNLLAGSLEIADTQFSQLAADVDSYSADVERKTKAGNLDVELSSASLIEYLTNVLQQHAIYTVTQSPPQHFAPVIDELHDFGVGTLQDLAPLLSKDFLNALKAAGGTTSQVGFLRKAMIYADIDKYFSEAWKSHWVGMSASTAEMIRNKWGKEKLESTTRTLHLRSGRRKKR